MRMSRTSWIVPVGLGDDLAAGLVRGRHVGRLGVRPVGVLVAVAERGQHGRISSSPWKTVPRPASCGRRPPAVASRMSSVAGIRTNDRYCAVAHTSGRPVVASRAAITAASPEPPYRAPRAVVITFVIGIRHHIGSSVGVSPIRSSGGHARRRRPVAAGRRPPPRRTTATNSSVRSSTSSSRGDVDVAFDPRREDLADAADEHRGGERADRIGGLRAVAATAGVLLDEAGQLVAGGDPAAVHRLAADGLDVEHASPPPVVVDEPDRPRDTAAWTCDRRSSGAASRATASVARARRAAVRRRATSSSSRSAKLS